MATLLPGPTEVLAELAPTDGTSFDQLCRIVDSALYQHKLSRGEAAELRPPLRVGRSSGRRRSVSADPILAAITEAFFLLDHDCRFAYVNDAAAELLASPAQVLLDRRICTPFRGGGVGIWAGVPTGGQER